MRVLLCTLLLACSSNGSALTKDPATQITASSPRDDGKPAEGSSGGVEHAAALEQLKVAPTQPRADRQNSVAIPLPDPDHWMRVRFWGFPTLVGFRYGQGHHAVVAGYVTHVDDNTVQGACTKSFEAWANPMMEAYDVDVKRDAPQAAAWHRKATDAQTSIIDIDVLHAHTATLIASGDYMIAYGVYPAWKGACLTLGIAVPIRDGDETRAREARDRFAKDVLPKIEILSDEEPKERY